MLNQSIEKETSVETSRYPSGLERFIPAAVRIAGSTVAAGIAALSGDPVLGAAAGQALAEVGEEFSHRVLSPRQEQRVGAVIALAAAAVNANEVLGQPIRDDGFFDGDRSDGEEVIEGVLLAAMHEHEEKKLPYMANMLANIASVPTIDINTANWMITQSEDLTWLKIQLIAIIGDSDKYPLPDSDLSDARPKGWKLWAVYEALRTLIDSDSMLQHTTLEPSGSLGIPRYDLRINALKPSVSGKLIYGAMELDAVPRADLLAVYTTLFKLIPGTSEDAIVAQRPADVTS